MNALTKAARFNHKRETFINYAIVVVAGIVLGAMFAMGV
jgi:hypothetical protein